MNHAAQSDREQCRCEHLAPEDRHVDERLGRMQLEPKKTGERDPGDGEPAHNEARCPAVIGGEGQTQQKRGITDQQG
jgi:hypothetical protein